MKNRLAALAAFGAISAMLVPGVAWVPYVYTSILPGMWIGRMELGSDGAQVLNHFAKPDVVDAGMNQTTQIWLGNGKPVTTLAIHTTANGPLDARPLNGVTIDQARTTSPAFTTRWGVGVGSTRAQVLKQYPHVQWNQGVGPNVMYVDVRRGIAFEFAHNASDARCTAITIMKPGTTPTLSGAEIASLIHNHRSVKKP